MNVESQGFINVTRKWSFQGHLTTKIIISTRGAVSQEYGSKLCLPKTLTVNVQRLAWCHCQMAISRPSSHQNYHFDLKLWLLTEWLKALPSKDLDSECAEASPESPMNAFFKSIFPLKLSYCIDSKFCLKGEWLEALSPRDLSNEGGELRLLKCHREIVFPRPFFPLKLSY